MASIGYGTILMLNLDHIKPQRDWLGFHYPKIVTANPLQSLALTAVDRVVTTDESTTLASPHFHENHCLSLQTNQVDLITPTSEISD